ncbi:MAG: hypothetical protein E7266_04905 [Lachnospiraceae bacterium]|nr:hypothetical protein [Lachnospiraceae bacterium]
MRRNLIKKTVAVMAMSAMMVATLAQSAFAAEKVTYYFVDCGDYVVDTVNPADMYTDDTRDDNDALGIYQSVTDQAYGADATTGKSWGIVADAYVGDYDGAFGVRLTGAWAFEYNAASADAHRNWSNTYSNGCPASQTPTLTWKFELPAGTYEVEVCAVNPWGNCSNVTVKGNDTTVGTIDTIVQTNGGATDIETKYGGETVKGNVTIGDDGILTLVATNGNDNAAGNQCVNIAWIKIVGDAVEETTEETPTTGDATTFLPAVLLAVSAVTAVIMRKKSVVE